MEIMRGNPDGSLSSTVRLAPQGLLSFRYIDGTYLSKLKPCRAGVSETKLRLG